MSYSSFCQALYLLQITNSVGRVNVPNKKSASRGKLYREQLEKKEKEFATNFWNIINRYLFKYVGKYSSSSLSDSVLYRLSNLH